MSAANLAGRRYGRLLVLGLGEPSADGAPRWRCRCDCGGVALVRAQSLIAGRTQSCGCLKVEAAKRAMAARVEKARQRREGKL